MDPIPLTQDVSGELGRAIAAMVMKEGDVATVFGAPIKLETHTIVPVARISIGGGAGGVRAIGAAIRRLLGRADAPMSPSNTLAGGLGGGVDVRPVGFVHEQDGHVQFTPIDLGPERKR